jgi:hypothetical protein
MITFKTTATQHVNDLTAIQDAQQLVARAKREGSAYLFVPVAMLEALIERATRPHD